MKIKKICYYSVPKKESATCNCCGKSIKNIVAITTPEDEYFLFGGTCFDKRVKNNAKSFQIKEINKILKSIKFYCESLNKWETLTEVEFEKEQYNGLPFANWNKETEELETFEKYKTWVIKDLIPCRLEAEQKKLSRYSSIEL